MSKKAQLRREQLLDPWLSLAVEGLGEREAAPLHDPTVKQWRKYMFEPSRTLPAFRMAGQGSMKPTNAVHANCFQNREQGKAQDGEGTGRNQRKWLHSSTAQRLACPACTRAQVKSGAGAQPHTYWVGYLGVSSTKVTWETGLPFLSQWDISTPWVSVSCHLQMRDAKP